MAYMIYQQYTTAVHDAYEGRSDVYERFEEARAYRIWLESLDLGASVKGVLVEQARTLEDAFRQLTQRRSR